MAAIAEAEPRLSAMRSARAQKVPRLPLPHNQRDAEAGQLRRRATAFIPRQRHAAGVICRR